MNIAIIGTGNVGRALATSTLRAGHTVTIAGRDATKASTTATELGVRSASTARQAAADAEIVILAVPSVALAQVAQDLAGVVDGKTIVDATNRMQPDATTASNAETLQQLLPGAHVVKAFNTSFASRQADPQIGGVRVDGYVAGDDATAKQQVLDLAEQIGYSPVDAGPFAVSRTLEGLAWINISRNLDGGSWQGGLVLMEPAA